MDKIKILGFVVVTTTAFIGCITGVLNTYTIYDESKFRKPYFRHEEIVKSYINQIESTKARKGKNLDKLREEYEQFEQNWRHSMNLISLISPIENLTSTTLPQKDIKQIEKLVALVEQPPGGVRYQGQLGSAYLVLGDYQEALQQYKIAEINTHEYPNIYMLQAMAYVGLADEESNPQIRNNAKEDVVRLIELAYEKDKKKVADYLYLEGNDRLRNIVDTRNPELIKQLNLYNTKYR